MVEPYGTIFLALWFIVGFRCVWFLKSKMKGQIYFGHILLGTYLTCCGFIALIAVQLAKEDDDEPFVLDWVFNIIEKICSIKVFKLKGD